MKRKRLKSFTLSKETLRNLEAPNIPKIVGGFPIISGNTQCTGCYEATLGLGCSMTCSPDC
jgi:hypothetical protein